MDSESLRQQLDPRLWDRYWENIDSAANKEKTAAPEKWNIVHTLNRSADTVRPILEEIRTGGRRNFIKRLNKLWFDSTVYSNLEIQKDLLLDLFVLLIYFTPEEIDEVVNEYQKFTVVVDAEWNGRGCDENEQREKLLALATAEVQNSRDYDPNRNASVTFVFLSETGEEEKRDSYLLVVELDAKALHFLLSEANGWVRVNGDWKCLLKFGRCLIHNLNSRFKDQRDYPRVSNLTGEPMFDRNNHFVSRCLALTGEASGLIEGTGAMFLNAIGNGVNEKRESGTSAANENVSIAVDEAHGYYWTSSVRGLNDYIDWDELWRGHRIVCRHKVKSHPLFHEALRRFRNQTTAWLERQCHGIELCRESLTRRGKLILTLTRRQAQMWEEERARAVSPNASSEGSFSNDTPSSPSASSEASANNSSSESEENEAPRSPSASRKRPSERSVDIFSNSTIKSFSPREREFVDEVHKASEHQLSCAIISANAPDQAIERIIQILNASLERSTSSVEPFQASEFRRADGALYVIGFELQLFLICRWKPNEKLGVFVEHAQTLWRRLRNGNDKTVELENGVILIHISFSERDLEAKRLWNWMQFITNRQPTESTTSFKYRPKEDGYHGGLLAEMGVCFDKETYDAARKQWINRDVIQRQREDDTKKKSGDSRANALWAKYLR